MAPWNRRFLLETIIFRFHVKLGECMKSMFRISHHIRGHFTSAVTNINSQTWIQKNSANHPKVWTKMFTSRWIFWLNESAFHGWKCDCDLFWDGEFHVTRKGGPKGHFHWIIWSLWFTFSCAMSIHIKLTPSTQLRSAGKIVTPVPSNAQHFQWGGLPIWTAK